MVLDFYNSEGKHLQLSPRERQSFLSLFSIFPKHDFFFGGMDYIYYA
jgi:hypothetical protein